MASQFWKDDVLIGAVDESAIQISKSMGGSGTAWRDAVSFALDCFFMEIRSLRLSVQN
jgi:hypothetical protein